MYPTESTTHTEIFCILFAVCSCIVPGSAQEPDDLSTEPIAPSAVRLTWEDQNGSEDGYRIERRIENDHGAQWHGEWHVIAEVSGDRRRFESVGLRGDVLVDASETFPRNTEGDIIELKNGDLIYVYGRWPGGGDHTKRVRLGIIRSRDGGDSWSEPGQTWIPSAVAPPQLFHVPGRDAIMLAWNPYVGKGRRLGPRPILGAWFSRDGGRSWSGYRQLESGPTKGRVAIRWGWMERASSRSFATLRQSGSNRSSALTVT